jgi:hypothetical protein
MAADQDPPPSLRETAPLLADKRLVFAMRGTEAIVLLLLIVLTALVLWIVYRVRKR